MMADGNRLTDLEDLTGVSRPRVLLPGPGVDLERWAVLACDQHTSPYSQYWPGVEKFVGQSPSTVNLIFPEFYLEGTKNKIEQRIKKIRRSMTDYLEQKILVEADRQPHFVYLQRTLANGLVRHGLLVALDLEKYRYQKDSQSLIRPTEGTIEERLPIRVRIRQKAPLEFPHIMMLIDDRGKNVIEPLRKKTREMVKLVDFELMMGGGHLKAYLLKSQEMEKKILAGLRALAEPEFFRQKYGVSVKKKPLLIAAGDGNHSLATAKVVWQKTKKKLQKADKPWQNHPARFALVQLVNVYDQALVFEPIHRVLYSVGDERKFFKNMVDYFQKQKSKLEMKKMPTLAQMLKNIKKASGDKIAHVWGMSFIENGKLVYRLACLRPPIHTLAVGSLQNFLDGYLARNKKARIDYLHGEEAVSRDSKKEGNIGFYLPAMDKTGLFKAVINDGVTPRKTFSMGSADTKAYYVFGRRIL